MVRLRDLGLAKKDDPIYKEGLTIYTPKPRPKPAPPPPKKEDK